MYNEKQDASYSGVFRHGSLAGNLSLVSRTVFVLCYSLVLISGSTKSGHGAVQFSTL